MVAPRGGGGVGGASGNTHTVPGGRACCASAGEATVHEVVIRSGKKAERHLCEQREAGLAAPTPTQVSDLLGKRWPVRPERRSRGRRATLGDRAGRGGVRGSCNATFADFKATGLLGCAECYRTFEALLGPILERAHDGGVHHVGKVPRAALERSRRGGEQAASAILGTAIERAKRVESLRRALEDAVAGEQYERAVHPREGGDSARGG